MLVVEHKDRLTRVGFFRSLGAVSHEVVNTAEEATHDLMEDLVSIMTSFAARLYGRRRGKKTQLQALKEAG